MSDSDTGSDRETEGSAEKGTQKGNHGADREAENAGQNRVTTNRAENPEEQENIPTVSSKISES